MSGLRVISDRVRGEQGFGMIEVLVAFVLLVIAVGATFQILNASTRQTFRAEESQVMLNVAQREVERLRELNYNQVALTSMPTTSSDPDDPRSRVSGTTFAVGNGQPPAELIVNGGPLHDGGTITGGQVNPGPTPFTAGDISGDIYRFVVWQDDPGCDDNGEYCEGTQDFKRVIVAVKLDHAPTSHERPYEEVQSDFSDPEATTLTTNPPANSGVVTGQQFWISDTRCSINPDEPPRETPTDHPTHNTLGTCADADPNRPDSLLIEPPPPDPEPNDPALPARQDYATELEPASGEDKGLQMRQPDNSGCNTSPTGSSQHQLIHRWLSAPMPSDFVMTGRATLELYTRTINEEIASGKICVFLFKRPGTGADSFYFNAASPSEAYFTYSETTWPTGTGFQPVSLRMDFDQMTLASRTVLAGQRLGLAIALERDGTSADVIEFSYDHPDDRSRLEVLTTTPLD
jgi:type II secretory pathway pseudopilin PulG